MKFNITMSEGSDPEDSIFIAKAMSKLRGGGDYDDGEFIYGDNKYIVEYKINPKSITLYGRKPDESRTD